MFVGLHRERYFPSTLMPKLELVSDLPAAILNKMPSKIPLAPTANRSMIIQEMRKFWVIPENKNSGSIVIMLRRPAELREILITYGPTSDPRSDPHTMDLSIGYYLDDMKLVYSVNTTYFHSTYPNKSNTFNRNYLSPSQTHAQSSCSLSHHLCGTPLMSSIDQLETEGKGLFPVS